MLGEVRGDLPIKPLSLLVSLPPREFVEKTLNVVHWTDFPDGGHFPFYEQPLGYVADMRKFGRLIKGQRG